MRGSRIKNQAPLNRPKIKSSFTFQLLMILGITDIKLMRKNSSGLALLVQRKPAPGQPAAGGKGRRTSFLPGSYCTGSKRTGRFPRKSWCEYTRPLAPFRPMILPAAAGSTYHQRFLNAKCSHLSSHRCTTENLTSYIDIL